MFRFTDVLSLLNLLFQICLLGNRGHRQMNSLGVPLSSYGLPPLGHSVDLISVKDQELRRSVNDFAIHLPGKAKVSCHL